MGIREVDQACFAVRFCMFLLAPNVTLPNCKKGIRYPETEPL